MMKKNVNIWFPVGGYDGYKQFVARIFAKYFLFSFIIEKVYCLKIKTNYQEISHFNCITIADYILSIFIIPAKFWR